ncbi:MAG: hypothetical protein EZS28_005107 [Streblomastix strix]|uniref:Tail fiber protein n=1 Tax=Streblomastix strix TaxID=222440 RepID=A0A5J4WWW6_9EUKA|nr:MAG: hypothetical protein EZS28_005107 [Streblomastix strix]
MIHPAIGGALGAGANLAGAKRGGSSGGMMSDEEYQLFIDNNNALVYAANKQILDGMASDYALKIDPPGLLTIKNLKVINFDFIALINYAESGTVWMFDQNWYNSEDIVPDQVTPASDATPLSDGTASAGISTDQSRGDHVHPRNVTSTIPISDSASGSVGTSNYYAINDHSHPLNITSTVPPQDSASGSVETNASNIPIVDGVGANGTSSFYARQDHVHLQQLTYDGNVTATKFIKTGGLATEVLCTNGDTTTISNKISREYNASAGVWIRLCNFPAGASVGSPFIEFKVYSTYNAVQTIKLLPYYTENGITNVYGIFNAPVKVSSYYDIEQSVNQLFHNHSGSGTSAIYSAYVRLESAGTVTIVVSDQSTYYTNRITEILTQDVVQVVANGTQIPITYDLANGGIINNMLQVNPTGRTYTTFNNADHSVGLSIIGDSSIIKFNGNELVNVRTDQTITGIKTFGKLLQDNPSADGTYNEGIRISRSTKNQWSNIQFSCDPNTNSGGIDNQWIIGTSGNNDENPLGFIIAKAGQEGQTSRGLQISADGNTLTFNGSVVAGIGATNGATNGSVNYSAGNPILCGLNSVDTNGGFYSGGPKVYWRAKPVTLGAVPVPP